MIDNKPTIYIDQNILGYISENKINLYLDLYQIVFSETHFKEFTDDNCKIYCSALSQLNARCIRINLNEKFEILNNATLLEYNPVDILYNDFKNRISEYNFENIFDNLLARLAGADNYPDILNMPNQLKGITNKLLSDIPFKNIIGNSINLVFDQLNDIIVENLSKVQSIEKNREKLNTDKGKLGTIKGLNIIERINDYIKTEKNIDLLEYIDQYFDQTSIYLKIISLNYFLNMVGYNADKKLSSVKKIPNIRYDSEHIAHGAFCDYLISEDRRLINKALAIYQYLNLKPNVIQIKVNDKRK